MSKLIEHRYGKAQARVLKILREGPVHTLRDIEVRVQFGGDFESSYTSGDNTRVVPTDTIKNTINILAREHLAEEIEPFAIKLAEHFLSRYPQVQTARIDINQRDWRRMEIEGKPHPHSFVAGAEAKRFTRVVRNRGSQSVE